MNIAYLIQAYADPNALKQLIERLLKDPNSMVFVHLDLKSSMKRFFYENDRVVFIKKRELVSWAGYKQGKLIINLIEEAVKYPRKFDYYCFVSESDYPIFSGGGLQHTIEKTQNIMLNCSKYQKNKVEKYWFYDFGIKSAKINKCLSKIANFFSEILYKTKLLHKKNRIEIYGKECDVYFSGPFWKYNYSQLKCIFRTFIDNPSIEKYFKHAFAPCELVVPTIIANTDYKDEIVFRNHYIDLNDVSGLCYFKYTGSRVNVLSDKDFDDIIAAQKPFVRKIKANVSDKLIQMLEEYDKNINII